MCVSSELRRSPLSAVKRSLILLTAYPAARLELSRSLRTATTRRFESRARTAVGPI